MFGIILTVAVFAIVFHTILTGNPEDLNPIDWDSLENPLRNPLA
jgi:hypothetical protein